MKRFKKGLAFMENLRSSFLLKTYFPEYLGVVFFVTALLWAADCRADNVTLAWDASPDPVTGYTVFYGEESVLTHSSTPKPVGNVLQCTIADLLPGHTYYFALKASYYNNESGFSNEKTVAVNADGTVTDVSVTTTSTVSTTPSTSSVSTTPSTSTALATSTTASTIPSTTSALTTTPATSTALATSTTASTLPSTTSSRPTTSSTTPAETTSTTANADMTKKYVMGGKGSGSIDGGAPAVKNEQTAFAAKDSAFTDQGAIAVFNDTDSTSQLSVAWDDYNDLNGEARIATGDIDGDKKDEIIIGLGPVEGNAEIPGGKFQILDDDFTPLGWGQIDWSSYNSVNGESWPACGDIDGDGVDEILIGTGVGGNGRIEVFKFKNGKAVHTSWIKVGWEDYCIAGGGVRPACGNIDLDRKEEIILGLYPPNEVFLPGGKFEVLDGSAKHLAWGVVDWPEYNALSGETRPACGDINRTVRDEILLGLGKGSGGRIPLYSYALGTVTLKTWLNPAGEPDYRTENGETRLSCGDMDGDGLDEILIGFGKGGQGMMELHDDGLHDFSILSRLLIPDDDYNIVNGEAYPAIKDIKSDYSRVMNFFLKSLSNKRPKQP